MRGGEIDGGEKRRAPQGALRNRLSVVVTDMRYWVEKTYSAHPPNHLYIILPDMNLLDEPKEVTTALN